MNYWPQLNNGQMTILIFATWIVLMTWIYNTKDPNQKKKRRSKSGV